MPDKIGYYFANTTRSVKTVAPLTTLSTLSVAKVFFHLETKELMQIGDNTSYTSFDTLKAIFLQGEWTYNLLVDVPE